MTRLRVAVVGVGYLGKHHARLLSSMPDVELVGVVDTNLKHATEVAAEYRTRPMMDVRELNGKVDAVTVAVPTEIHRDVAVPFLATGIPVLVEKPLARSLGEADAIIAAAAKSGALVAVGHTERFNPAVAVAREHLTDPRFIEVHRLGVFPERSLDIDVVFDVMIHDLDIILAVDRSEVTGVEAIGVPVLTPRVDIANARIRFASGCIANITASRISKDKVRKMRFFQPDMYASIDCAAQELEVWRLQPAPGDRPQIAGGPVAVTTAEPLKQELADFVDAIRAGRAPTVTGEDGRRALALATKVAGAMEASEGGAGFSPPFTGRPEGRPST